MLPKTFPSVLSTFYPQIFKSFPGYWSVPPSSNLQIFKSPNQFLSCTTNHKISFHVHSRNQAAGIARLERRTPGESIWGNGRTAVFYRVIWALHHAGLPDLQAIPRRAGRQPRHGDAYFFQTAGNPARCGDQKFPELAASGGATRMPEPPPKTRALCAAHGHRNADVGGRT